MPRLWGKGDAMQTKVRPWAWSWLLPCCLIVLVSCLTNHGPKPGTVVDEARLAGRDAASLPGADEDYYRDMDGGVPLTPAQVVGRNNWVVWTAGNDRLWDVLTDKSAGTFDLLKTISSYPYPEELEAAAVRPPQPLEVARPGQRALLRGGQGAGPGPLRPVARQAPRRLSARSLRERGEVPGRQATSARGKTGPAGVLLRLGHRHRGPAAVPESGLRRKGRRRPGIRSATTPIPATTCARASCGPTGSACPAASATSGPTRSIRPPIRKTRSGRTCRRTSAPSTSGSTASSAGMRTRAASPTSSSTPRARAPSTPPWSPPTTSTTRAR